MLPDDEREVRGKAQTIRKVAEDTYAFGFSQIPEADRERLIKFVFARQQSLLRPGEVDRLMAAEEDESRSRRATRGRPRLDPAHKARGGLIGFASARSPRGRTGADGRAS